MMLNYWSSSMLPLLTAIVVALLAAASHPERSQKVCVVGGGISGLVVGHVLAHQHPNIFNVTVLEASNEIGGNIRQLPDPLDANRMLNIGHATHMGMFWNLRLVMWYLNEQEWPVGVGPNEQPGLFRMLSVNAMNKHGQKFQPPLQDILSPQVWLEAFVFYYYSHREPARSLDDLLSRHFFSDRFVSILYWAVATFEFDKSISSGEIGEYALGTCRALLVTQVFFKFLLCDRFQGQLPTKLNDGLYQELVSRIHKHVPRTVGSGEDDDSKMLDATVAELKQTPLASYFTADYRSAMQKLADGGAGTVRTGTTVTSIRKVKHDEGASDTSGDGNILIETATGEKIFADCVVLTIQPCEIQKILNENDFPEHCAALGQIESGAVGVRIVHAKDLPFVYPPQKNNDDNVEEPCIDDESKGLILGIFDISELTTTASGNQRKERNKQVDAAGWLSIAYPFYGRDNPNWHHEWLRQIPSADETIYPWTRAVASFPSVRKHIVDLQGHNNVYLTGHTLTGVNKASELQVANALKLCYEHFDAMPPWQVFFPTPLLPDCNDEDAFGVSYSFWGAVRMALKNMIGSFLLVGVVSKLGTDVFD